MSELFTKPKVYKVGDTVEVLRTINVCFEKKHWKWTSPQKESFGQKLKIKKVIDNYSGVSYILNNNHLYPFYTVKRVAEIETIKIGGIKYSKKEIENALKNLKPVE